MYIDVNFQTSGHMTTQVLKLKECLISILDPVYSERKLVSHAGKVCILIMFTSIPP